MGGIARGDAEQTPSRALRIGNHSRHSPRSRGADYSFMRKKNPSPVAIPPVAGIIQMVENTWYKLDSPEVTECCDCGLVHHTEYMMENGHMFWRSVVDKKATAAARKLAGIKVIKNAKT